MHTVEATEAAVHAVERAQQLDGVVTAVKKAVDGVLPSPLLRDALHGVWLGHPLHPALVELPLGFWTCASLLDLLPGNRRVARALVGLGLVSALPTAAAGAADWSELLPRQQRVGLVHAASNVVTVCLEAGSWLARRRGRQGRGVLLGLAGMATSTIAAYLGGHMAYRQAVGVNHAEAATHLLPHDFTRLCALDDLPEGRPVRMLLDGVQVFVLRRGRHVDVLTEQCAHLGGPLSEGTLSGDGDELCITCPWHGSTYRLRDGEVRRGPAVHPEPVLQVLVEADGTVQARLPEEA